MELLFRNEARPVSRELRPLPSGDPLAIAGRKREGDEEAHSFIAPQASG